MSERGGNVIREVSFEIQGQPVPKARPRVTRLKNGLSRTFTPKATEAYAELVAWSYRKEVGEGIQLEGDLYFKGVFHREGKRRADFDNLAKAVTDALNGIAYQDDAQIVSAEVWVLYGAKQPRAKVTLRELEDPEDQDD